MDKYLFAQQRLNTLNSSIQGEDSGRAIILARYWSFQKSGGPNSVRNTRNRAHASFRNMGNITKCWQDQHFCMVIKKKNAPKVRQKMWIACESDLAGVG